MARNQTQVSRDPFARHSIMRETVTPLPGQTCSWCGNVSRLGHAGHIRLYRYIVSPDAGRDSTIPGLFCSVDCMRSYHNG